MDAHLVRKNSQANLLNSAEPDNPAQTTDLTAAPRMAARNSNPAEEIAAFFKPGHAAAATFTITIRDTASHFPSEFRAFLTAENHHSAEEFAGLCIRQFSTEFIQYFADIEFEPSTLKLPFIFELSKQLPEQCAQNFAQFDINLETDRLALAKNCETSAIFNLDNFNLSESSRFQLASFLIEASDAASAAAMDIQKFALSNEYDRLQLAKSCINNASFALLINIRGFNIGDENERFQLALAALKLQSDENNIDAFHLNNFNLTNPEMRRVAALTLSKVIGEKANWPQYCQYILNGRKIETAAPELIEAYLSYQAYNPTRSVKPLSNAEAAFRTALDQHSRPAPAVVENFLVRNDNDYVKNLLKQLAYAAPVCEMIFDAPLEKIISQRKESPVTFLKWVSSLLFYIENNKINETVLRKDFKLLLTELAKQTDVKYRALLTDQIFSVPPEKLSKLDINNHQSKLIPLALASVLQSPSLDNFISGINPKILKDGKNQRRLIEVILTLRNTNIPVSKFDSIIKSTLEKTELITNADEKFKQAMINLSKLKAMTEIDEQAVIEIADGKNTFQKIQESLIIKTLGVIKNSLPKYESIFDKYRESSSILTYMGRLKNHPALSTLKNFINAVIEGNFPALRYQSDALLDRCDQGLVGRWKQNISAPLKSNKDHCLNFYDEHQAWIRMGTDIRGSCQRINGDPSLNCGLIGAAMDGKQKLVTVTDKDGKILRRAILRLMWAAPTENEAVLGQKGEPYLLMEKIYPVKLSDTENNDLIDFASEQAKRIGLSLVVSSDIKTASTNKLATCHQFLHSGPIKYPVYSDAKQHLQNRDFILDPTEDETSRYFYRHVAADSEARGVGIS